MLRQLARFVFLVVLLIVPVAMAGAQDGAPPATPPPAAPRPHIAPNAGSAPTPLPIPDGAGQPGHLPAAPDCGPDLIPYSPPERSYPMTPNSVRHTMFQDSVLYAGKPTYFDTVYANVGTEVAAGTFYVGMWVDSDFIGDYGVTDYRNGYYSWWDDWEGVVETPGWHTAAIMVDYNGLIAECDESNNYWAEEFYWEPVDGWWGQYYNNENLAGDPVFVRDDPAIQFDWLSDSPAPGIVNDEYFSIFWERDVSFQAGTYLFQLSRDDGMLFWIDSGLKLDAWVNGVADHAVIVDLSPGTHTLELAVNDTGGWARAMLNWERCYSLSVTSNPATGGDVAISTDPNCGNKYINGTVVTLTAGPESGYTFSNWSGDATGTNNPRNVTMNSDKIVTANFTPICYTLTTAVNPSGSGVVNANPAPNCAGGKYTAGTVVALTASANSGYAFANWSGAVTGTANPRNVTMDGDRSVTANFTPICYSLTLSVNPTDGGTVSPSLAPNCAGGKYIAGTVVTLTAVANASSGYTFANWSGDVSGTANPRNVTLNGDRNVTANFNRQCYSLTIAVDPPGVGTVNLDPPANCGGQYTAGTAVSLTAAGSAGWAFDHWSGDLSGEQNPKSVTMNGHRVVTASYVSLSVPCYALTLNHTGQGSDPQATPGQSAGCDVGDYVAGATIQLTADPADGWHVAGWRGAGGDGVTMTNSLIMPAAARAVWVDYVADAPVAQRVALPMVLYGAEYGFPGPLEDEPNDDWDQANGPLIFGREYQGYPDDRFDWYAFDLLTARTLVITLENVTGDDPQLTLFYQTGNPEGWKAYAWAEPFTIIYPAQPGRYYVRVYINDDFNATTLYRLRVNP